VKEFPFIGATVSTFAHATEDEGRVVKAMRNIIPAEAGIDVKKLKGHHGNPIFLFESRITRKAILRKWWADLVKKLGEVEIEKIRRAIPAKIDESCQLYLRLDKQRAYLGKLAFTEGDDIVHLKLKISAWPAKQKVAVEAVTKFLTARWVS
jgi:hypothetical protein